MNEEMQTTGYTGADSASGPTAGYDPVQRFRGKIKKKDAKKLVAPGNKLKEGIEMKSRLFQYKVRFLMLVRLYYLQVHLLNLK